MRSAVYRVSDEGESAEAGRRTHEQPQLDLRPSVHNPSFPSIYRIRALYWRVLTAVLISGPYMEQFLRAPVVDEQQFAVQR
jgi:hypothetical protein